MTPWEARDLLTAKDPERALRANAVDPLPPRPKPCTCADEDKAEVHMFGSFEPRYMCVGLCRR